MSHYDGWIFLRRIVIGWSIDIGCNLQSAQLVIDAVDIHLALLIFRYGIVVNQSERVGIGTLDCIEINRNERFYNFLFLFFFCTCCATHKHGKAQDHYKKSTHSHTLYYCYLWFTLYLNHTTPLSFCWTDKNVRLCRPMRESIVLSKIDTLVLLQSSPG